MINLYQSNDHTASLASCVRIENDHTTLLVYQIIHIQRQNSVKFNTSNHIFSICRVLSSHSNTKALSEPRTVQSSGEPLLTVKPEAA